jgi:hypothetical protein
LALLGLNAGSILNLVISNPASSGEKSASSQRAKKQISSFEMTRVFLSAARRLGWSFQPNNRLRINLNRTICRALLG